MAGPSVLSLDYGALLTTTLMNQSSMLNDQIGASNYMFFRLKEKGLIKEIDDLGERMKVNLMYELATVDSYAGYDELPVDPVDGLTAAFYDWRNAVSPVSISGDEKAKNRGEAQIIDLLEAKSNQAKMAIKEFWSKAVLQGKGVLDGTSITTAYTSAVNGSSFLDPLPLLVKYDPTTSTVIGNINQSTATWWRNQKVADASTTFAGFRKNIANLYNSCGKGSGGFPDIHICDQLTYEFYEDLLRTYHQNPSYARADIPFENIAFRGNPLTWDEFVPDVAGGSTTQSSTSGTWFMLNSAFLVLKADRYCNFTARPAVTPANQDATISHILWRGSLGVSNRRKHGVQGSIDTTIAS